MNGQKRSGASRNVAGVLVLCLTALPLAYACGSSNSNPPPLGDGNDASSTGSSGGSGGGSGSGGSSGSGGGSGSSSGSGGSSGGSGSSSGADATGDDGPGNQDDRFVPMEDAGPGMPLSDAVPPPPDAPMMIPD